MCNVNKINKLTKQKGVVHRRKKKALETDFRGAKACGAPSHFPLLSPWPNHRVAFLSLSFLFLKWEKMLLMESL